jgi:ATP-dependent Clp protease adaptor protein ClpS
MTSSEAAIVTDESRAGVEEPGSQVVLKQRSKTRKKRKRQPRYNVILWDDSYHTFQYVINLAQQLFGHPVEKGFQIAEEVHTRGRAIMLTTTREHAELKRDQIHAFGKDPQINDCAGSMSATIEPLPE